MALREAHPAWLGTLQLEQYVYAGADSAGAEKNQASHWARVAGRLEVKASPGHQLSYSC